MNHGRTGRIQLILPNGNLTNASFAAQNISAKRTIAFLMNRHTGRDKCQSGVRCLLRPHDELDIADTLLEPLQAIRDTKQPVWQYLHRVWLYNHQSVIVR